MTSSGLVSVTFRNLQPLDILHLAVQARLSGIEWGGDVHVPPGDLTKAKFISGLTQDHGIKPVSFGSYYRAGISESASFEALIDTSLALGAPTIRVWAGDKASNITPTREIEAMVADFARICKLAESANLTIATEFHSNTFCDCSESVLRLINEVEASNLKTFWQPLQASDIEKNLSEISQLSPYISHIHCFHWDGYDRLALAEGSAAWPRYIDCIVRNIPNAPILLEFVRNDNPDQLLCDADSLNGWLGSITTNQ